MCVLGVREQEVSWQGKVVEGFRVLEKERRKRLKKRERFWGKKKKKRKKRIGQTAARKEQYTQRFDRR